jgi:hypothetical protein
MKTTTSILLLLLPAIAIFSAISMISGLVKVDEEFRFKNRISMSCPTTGNATQSYHASGNSAGNPLPLRPTKPAKKHNRDNPGSCPHQGGSCTAAVCDREKFKRKILSPES